MRRENKSTTGSVVKDRRSQIWQFFWWAEGVRHSKALGRYPTKTAARLPQLARRRGNHNSGTAKAHASCGHPYNDERLWHCGAR